MSLANKKLGYARASGLDRSLPLQRKALKAAGCSMVFVEKEAPGAERDSGKPGAGRQAGEVQQDRPALRRAMARLKAGDTLVVWRLDRLGRSLPDLFEIMEDLSRRDIEFQSLCEDIDTGTMGGKLVFDIIASLADFEKHRTEERKRRPRPRRAAQATSL